MPLKSLLICIPTMGGVMKSQTGVTLAQLVKALLRSGVDASIHNIDSSDIVIARAQFAQAVLDSDKWDGLLFVDSDMAFRPGLVLRMLKLDEDAVAAAYTTRIFDWKKFAEAMRSHGVVEKARVQASHFVLINQWDPKKPRPRKQRGGFMTMAAAGLGCCLISRAALQAMADAGVATQRHDGITTKPIWGFFDQLEVNGRLYGEDYSFWYRWTELMGRDLWVCVDEKLLHIGQFDYTGRYADLLTRRSADPGASLSPGSGSADA